MSQGNWEWNGIKRDGGRFLWKQIYNAQKLGVRTMYGAMWDECVFFFHSFFFFTWKPLLPRSFRPFFVLFFFWEKKLTRNTAFFFFTWSSFRYDEGTVFIPVVTHKRLLPVSDEFRFMALDEDGYDLPADW